MTDKSTRSYRMPGFCGSHVVIDARSALVRTPSGLWLAVRCLMFWAFLAVTQLGSCIETLAELRELVAQLPE